MRQITRSDIEIGTPLITVEIPYSEFVGRFGAKHSEHPSDWDAPGPVELWFFELPWGHKVTFEYHLTISQVNIYLESLELDAVLEYIGLASYTHYVNTDTAQLLRSQYPVYTRDLSPSTLYRQDDNGNKAVVHSYESRRVADYYQRLYEARGHKQHYWVEQDGKA